ncbi:hypothetical protein BH09PLA1_BH09PLA1_19970 [soil metagenome]
MSDSSTITVHCECGKRLKAPAAAVGRKAKCPSCGNILVVEAPPPIGIEEPSDDPSLYALSNLDELAAQEAKAAAIAEQNDPNTRCPNCSMVMSGNAVICVTCGYDVRKGQVLSTTQVAPQETGGFLGLANKTEPKKDKLAPQGRFIVGLLMSVVLAIVASLPWFIVAFATDRDFYFLEVIVGLAAGFGMQIGQKGYSSLGGWASAGVTFIVLIAMRILVVIAVLIPLARKDLQATADAEKSAEQQEIDDRDPRVATLIARQELQAQHIDTESYSLDEKTIEKVEAANKRAEEKLRTMTRAEYLAMLPKLELDEIRSRLIYRQIDPEIRGMGLNPDFHRIESEKWTIARAAVTKRVDAMTPAQQKAELKKLDDQATADLQAEIARAQASGKISTGSDSGGSASTLGFVFGLMLVVAIFPLIFLVLAMAAAYKTAAGAVSG